MKSPLGPEVLAALCRPAAYPDDPSAASGVAWLQTHLSHVFLYDVPEDPDVHVRITVRQYMWLFDYEGPDGELGTDDDFTVDGLRVEVNKVVRFELESADIVHTFCVRELRFKQDAVPGRSISGWFDTNAEGTFEIGCAEICGQGHTRMRALLVVESQTAFDAWVQEQL